jgi:hypothetical protein
MKYYPAQKDNTEHPELTRLRALQPKQDPQDYWQKSYESSIKRYWLIHNNDGKAIQVVSVIGTKTKVISGSDVRYFKAGKPNLALPVTFTHIDTTAGHRAALGAAIDSVIRATAAKRTGVSVTDPDAAMRVSERYANGNSVTAIADLEGVSRRTVSRWLGRANTPI